MKKIKKWLIWIGVLLPVFAFIWWLFGPEKKEAPYESEAVERKNVFQSVSVTGKLKTEEELILNFESGGRIKSIKTYVGQRVAKGDTLASIDDAVLSQQLQEAKAALDKALAIAGASDDAIRESQEALDNAKDYYDEVKRLEDQKVNAADLAYENASDYYDDAKDYYDQVLSDNGASSSTTKSAKLTLTTALNSKKTAEEAKDTTRKARDLALVSADNSVDSAEEALKSAQSRFTKQSNDATVQSSRAAYQIALINLEKANLQAPVNGTITEVNYKAGEVLGSASFDLSSSSSGGFGKMISSDFIIESDVPESDILKIKLGQTTDITFDSLSNSEIFMGEVVEIEPAATVIQDVVYYKIKVAIKDVDNRLKAGMSADIDVHTADKSDVLAVPLRAITLEGKKEFVEIVGQDGNLIKKAVETGIRGDDGFVEIVSGLNQGDQVVTLKRDQQ